MNWYVSVLQNYVGFSGRAHRTEYWMFFLIHIIVQLVLTGVDAALGLGFLAALYSLAVLLPFLAVGARRLHDTGRSGWWLLIGLIPVIGAIVLLVLFVLEGERETNAYGPPPTPA